MKSAHILQSATLAAISLSMVGCGSQPLPGPAAAGNRAAVTRFSTPQTHRDGEPVPGKFIVKFRQGISASSADSISTLSQMGAQRVHALGSDATRMELVQVNSGEPAAAVAQKLSQNPMVEYAEPVSYVPFPEVFPASEDDAVDQPASYPNDPFFGRQYSHRVAHSQEGWAISQGDRRVIIGIVDSGVDVTHPDLRDKIVGTYNAADGNSEVVDHVGHGTHVAGIAAAITNNGIGVAGVAPNCGILAVKVAPGSSSYPTTDGIANGVIYAADHGASVINLSLGSRTQSQAITDAVKYAMSKNVLVMAATGNDSSEIKSYPAAVPGVVAVGSTDANDRRSRFSNYGPWVSVVAPGSDILSTFPLNSNLIGKTEYGSISGTSMATPFVTGVAAVIRSKYPTMPEAMVKRVLEVSADDKGAPGFDNEYGNGRVNLGAALTRAAEFVNKPDAAR